MGLRSWDADAFDAGNTAVMIKRLEDRIRDIETEREKIKNTLGLGEFTDGNQLSDDDLAGRIEELHEAWEEERNNTARLSERVHALEARVQDLEAGLSATQISRDLSAQLLRDQLTPKPQPTCAECSGPGRVQRAEAWYCYAHGYER